MGLRVARHTLISTPARFAASVMIGLVIALAIWVTLEWAGLSAALALAILGALGMLWMGDRWNRRDEAIAMQNEDQT